MPDRPRITNPYAHLTESQKRAVGTVGRSILVSAAAGSGKTTVLAERCAALVCDLPPDQRCEIDELLVVTFTDAAAGEMRSRIAEVVKKRYIERSQDQAYLQRQLYLLESADISTIHAFCKTLIQRWFPQARVDPQAVVLNADEAELLRNEVLEAFFVELYGSQEEIGQSFQALVDDYGGGSDRSISRILLHIHQYIGTLPDRELWLEEAVRRVDPDSPQSVLTRLHEHQSTRLARELNLQIAYHQHAAKMIRTCWPIAEMHAEAIEEHFWRLKNWYDKLLAGPQNVWESIATEIREHKFERAESRPRNLSDQEKAVYDAAKEQRDKTRELFTKRLVDPICSFTTEEYRQGLISITPYVRTLVELVKGFEKRYQSAKDAQAAVDFNDLQRYAFQLLADGDRPSEIARRLQQRYRHVLVDEFQDIDPLQEAILRLISRESADPPEGNLFAVGDLKQSIYRFRLAEPDLFSQRADAFASGQAPGELIHLQENFRSRSSVIEAINLIFRPLMSKSFGGCDYDAAAELHAGADYPTGGNEAAFDRPAVELHLLEPITEKTRLTTEDADASDNDTAGEGSIELEGIEREAYLIGRRIQQWTGDNPQRRHWHIADKTASGGEQRIRPIEYHDIVILLRSLPYKAQPIADVLRRMGIPVQVERDENSFDSTEFRDCLSLLQLLDNLQQDIPLAAVLRSPLLGEQFNETDLLKIRLLDKDIPFHEAVKQYAQRGSDQDLRSRLRIVLAALDRYRRQIQRSPAADVLWEIYEQSDYLAYVAGLPDGLRRREHLIGLHELARQFGRFNRQGLRRFLRFVEEMVAGDRTGQHVCTAGAEDNVVRIMTIHASKGLEFPVVILADLQKRFNLTDVNSNALLDRRVGIAMRAADPQRRIFFPTFVHQLAAQHLRCENLSEELRVLYVALTRAREHLLLVGRYDLKKIIPHRATRSLFGENTPALPGLQLETAACPLDWLMPAICTAKEEAVCWHNDKQQPQNALFKIYTYDRATTDKWRIPPAVEDEQSKILARLADLESLPLQELIADSRETKVIMDALTAHYPGLELTTLPARVAVSELKRRWDATFDPDDRQAPSRRRVAEIARPVFIAPQPIADAFNRGTATHRFLQHLDLTCSCDPADIKQQCRRLVEAGRLTPTDANDIMFESVEWFFDTELGRRILNHPGDVRREVAFVARIAPDRYDPAVTARDHRDVVLIRGMVDLLLVSPSNLEIVDYKTDRVEADACLARAQKYRTQIGSYATAMQGIYQRCVSERWLVFLHARSIIDVTE